VFAAGALPPTMLEELTALPQTTCLDFRGGEDIRGRKMKEGRGWEGKVRGWEGERREVPYWTCKNSLWAPMYTRVFLFFVALG